ncbi:unnamed protein product, partial [Effrenium voratum]
TFLHSSATAFLHCRDRSKKEHLCAREHSRGPAEEQFSVAVILRSSHMPHVPRSLTSVLLSLSHKHVLTAVDIREPCELPHLDDAAQRAREVEALAYAEPVEYLRHDILADDFLETLQQRVEEVGRPTAILAMHLCGRLSLQAIAAFESIRLVRWLILTPCCLPHASEAPEELAHIYGCGLSDPEQFDAWAAHLEMRLRESGAKVARRVEPGILSSRRTMFTAAKAAVATKSDFAE